MLEKKIRVNKEEYKLRWRLRGLLLFENAAGGRELGQYAGSITLFWCMLKANNENFNLDFEEFIDALDEQPFLLDEWDNFFTEASKEQEALRSKKEDAKGAKKKPSKS